MINFEKRSNVIVTNTNERQIRAFVPKKQHDKSQASKYLINKTVEAGTICA